MRRPCCAHLEKGMTRKNRPQWHEVVKIPSSYFPIKITFLIVACFCSLLFCRVIPTAGAQARACPDIEASCSSSSSITDMVDPTLILYEYNLSPSTTRVLPGAQVDNDDVSSSPPFVSTGKDSSAWSTSPPQQREAWMYLPWPSSNNTNFTVNVLQRSRMCKFFNLAWEPVDLYWQQPEKQQQPPLLRVKTLSPMSAMGLLAWDGSTFHIKPSSSSSSSSGKSSSSVQPFIIGPHTNLYIYHPPTTTSLDSVSMMMDGTEAQPKTDQKEEEAYQWWIQTLQFDQVYRQVTGRSFLSRYERPRPQHFMYQADYVGQTHVVPQLPLDKEGSTPLPRTWTVRSCAPRVLEMRHFLSAAEADHLLNLARAKGLQGSRTGSTAAGGTAAQTSQHSRASSNTWIWPHESTLVQALYRRAAHVLNISSVGVFPDPQGDRHDGPPTFRPVAEPLQVVHYLPGQEYKTHFDFGFPDPTHPDQPTRFATLLLYLNNVSQGGETAFPQAMTSTSTSLACHQEAHPAEEPIQLATFELRVQPELGKAVLFYSMLPDGNMDDLSQHAALPVLQGEKFLANMWIWDPYVDVASLK